jgi:hypothetical protein
MSKANLNNSDWKRLSEHVLYEWDQLNFCHEQLAKIPPKDRQLNRLWNVYLTAFVIHARSLRHFFYGDIDSNVHKNSDIMATDYCTNWNNIHPNMDQLIEAIKQWADKCAAHITVERDSIKPIWDWSKIKLELDHVWALFVSNVDHKKWPQ